MATYQELRNQFEALVEETEAARLAEFQAIVGDIHIKIAEYGITRKTSSVDSTIGLRRRKRRP